MYIFFKFVQFSVVTDEILSPVGLYSTLMEYTVCPN